MIFHVAGAEHAARINVLKSGNDFVWRLARGVNHDVQAAAMAHGHDGFDSPVLAHRVQNGIEEGDQGCHAFKGKSLRPQIAGLQHLLEEIGAD